MLAPARHVVAVTYFVFDLLRLDGRDTTRLPLLERKSLLRDALRFTAPLRFTTHRRAGKDARPALEQACSRGWEGLIATGWDTATLRSLRSELDALEQAASPFDGGVRERGVVHWVRPEFVAQIGFTEWTRDGMLRHPRYLGRRTDKAARDVVREEPA